MRRETDFVLERASWPTLLLEANGVVCRANQAARGLFGFGDSHAVSSLSAIWDDQNSDSAEKFLQEQSQTETAPLTLRLPNGDKTSFIAHVAKVAREGHEYFLLQLFKDSAPELAKPNAPPPVVVKEKKEDEFILQNAEWPVLLVRKNGGILRANRAAVRAFGPKIEQGDAKLETYWSQENGSTCLQFLGLPTSSHPGPLKFHLQSGLPGDFLGQVSNSDRDDILVLQLLKAPGTVAEKVIAPAGPAPAVSTPLEAPAAAGVEPHLAHKQKLDCALQLARSVALDFNNALTSILGHTSLLLSKAETNHPWRSSLGEIEKSAAKAAEIANDLAAFSRQEKDTKVTASGNLNLLLERTVEMFQGSMQSSITITRQLERKLFTANFDEAKLQQALVKIFENAVESIKESGKINVQTRNIELAEPLQDRTARLNSGNYVCVEVSDTGSGITDEVMPHVFEPFFTTKGSSHRGLGLAWVYGIVTNHGGGVAVSSQPGIGTTVRLYLPANRKIVRDAPAADGDLNGTQTILVVDDEELLLTMARMVLTSYGYTVLTADSGQKALELFLRSKKKVDLVITDLVMPNMSGRELSEHLRRAAPETRIIWSSGYVRASDEHEQERYLQKPFSAQNLLRKVKQALAQ